MTDFGFEQSKSCIAFDSYNLIMPNQELLKDTIDYVKKVQARKSANNRIFIPAGVGVLIDPQGKHKLFSNYGVEMGEVYDVPPLEREIRGAETDDVLRCGVFATNFNGCILLIHSGSPHALKDLISRGFDLAKLGGADLSGRITANVYRNPKEEGYLGPSYTNSENDWTSAVNEIGKKKGLDLEVEAIPITSDERIIR